MSAPIDPAYRQKMNEVAQGLDKIFNGQIGGPGRKTGFVLLVFPFGEANSSHRCNYISNGARREDIVALMKEMVARFEGSDAFPNTEGHA